MRKLNNDFLCLEAWTEIVGTLLEISTDEYCLLLQINEKLIRFRKGSKEASYIQTNLNNKFLGRELSLLKTDLPEKPLIVKLLPKKI